MGYINLVTDACIEPGDILFIVGHHKKDLLTRIKETIQSIYSSHHSFHHPEVLSVAVCTNKNESGVELYNHENLIKTPTIKSSFIMYKHLAPDQRKAFIKAYAEQKNTTEQYHQNHKSRMSFIKIFLALFKSSKQDKYDENKHNPSAETFCSRNIIETLNQIDPNIVKRGRHSLPATLEAGFHEACEVKAIDQTTTIDWDILKNNAPKFTRTIIPGEGKNLLNQLIRVIHCEFERMLTQDGAKSITKQEQIFEIFTPYLPLLHQNPPPELYIQYDIALELLAKLWPVLQINTGIFGITPTSYKNIRQFAHSQGLFDEDILKKAKTLESFNISSSLSTSSSSDAYLSGVDTNGTKKCPPPPVSIFKSLNPNNKPLSAAYDRCEVYSQLNVNQDPNNNDCFNMFKLGVVDALPSLLDPTDNPATKSREREVGVVDKPRAVCHPHEGWDTLSTSIQLNLSTEWQALPSRHAADKLIQLSISALNNNNFQIIKSQETSQYYIRAINPCAAKKIQIDYIIESPSSSPTLNVYKLQRSHPDICALLLKYSSFSGDKPQETSNNANIYLKAARTEKRGSCRLRAIACKEEMQRLYKDIPVNIVVNPYHCYLEIKLDGIWQSYCLGGVNTNMQQKLAQVTLTSLECCQKFSFFSNRLLATLPLKNKVQGNLAR